MHSDPNVRAARALLRTVTVKREDALAAMSTVERDISRTERALRRAEVSKWVHPPLAAAGALVVTAGAAWTAFATGHLPVGSTPWVLSMLAVVAVPTITSMLVAENGERRAAALAARVSHLHARVGGIRAMLGPLDITVAESRDVVRRLEDAAA